MSPQTEDVIRSMSPCTPSSVFERVLIYDFTFYYKNYMNMLKHWNMKFGGKFTGHGGSYLAPEYTTFYPFQDGGFASDITFNVFYYQVTL